MVGERKKKKKAWCCLEGTCHPDFSSDLWNYLVRASGAYGMMGQWWMAPHLEPDCLIMHTSVHLLKPKLHSRTLKMFLRGKRSLNFN